ncbi:hypothetical protein MUY14_36595 [Amycolatopsis sp. FBCC-B4732]|uniref:hypothetical protein n=1 Tax=Amycolatopsis sp. FBCC-B4732 TaxID=3079339 RepID=UPI001FF15C7C|nr:hypothetical protein [Amycolatopsis sp. FBCC-B4732]UOX87201.1 hypothetical protein MUY14_36595 [Amycolatopsis sp. FBCC-B4732]
MTAQDGEATTGRSDRSTFWCGGSLFNTSGQRLNEIDLEALQPAPAIADMTDDDWKQAAMALQAFECERGFQ